MAPRVRIARLCTSNQEDVKDCKAMHYEELYKHKPFESRIKLVAEAIIINAEREKLASGYYTTKQRNQRNAKKEETEAKNIQKRIKTLKEEIEKIQNFYSNK